MPLLAIEDLVRDIDLVVFDKDGTLIDFDHLWASRVVAAIRGTLAAAAPDPALEADFYRSLGADPSTLTVVPEGPLAVASIPSLTTLCAGVLYRHGRSWHEAERIAQARFRPVLDAPPEAAALKPIGDVAGLVRRLVDSGIKVAVLTTDSRLGTMATLPHLGIDRLVHGVVCGDDAIPTKPEPDGLLHLAGLAGVSPARVAMVGDSAGDMAAARAAGAALAVGVLSGTARREHLAGHADVVVPDIHAIRPVA